MSPVSGTSLTFFAIASISALVFTPADANTFLRAGHSSRQERISEEEVQMSLLAEVEGTLGDFRSSSSNRFEKLLAPMYNSLPKNEHGYLGYATVRYALHRLFMHAHGWFVKGLHAGGEHRNSTTSGLLMEQVPKYIQGVFEKRLGGRGLGLHELGVLAATIERLVHDEAINHLDEALKVHSYYPTSIMSVQQVDEVIDTYMVSYILGEDLSNMTLADASVLKEEMPEVYGHWGETQQFVRAVRQNITERESSLEQRTSGAFDFSLVARVAERVGEKFGSFQDQECKDVKARLVAMEERGTGRVRLSDFHSPAHGEGVSQFQESIAYLRQLGALDESDPLRPRVIIANYITGPSNCIASSSLYSVCCMDECEGFLGHLEREVAAPEATPEQIATLVAGLTSTSVMAPRKLSTTLLTYLDEIAAGHGGVVPLHGRLFGQWMHHAFPHECPYPHVSGTTNPLTPDEYEEATGQAMMATDEEKELHVGSSQALDDDEEPLLPWSPEEELLVVRPQPQMQASAMRNVLFFGAALRNAFFMMRNVVLFGSILMVGYGIVHMSQSASLATGAVGTDKHFA